MIEAFLKYHKCNAVCKRLGLDVKIIPVPPLPTEHTLLAPADDIDNDSSQRLHSPGHLTGNQMLTQS